MIFEWGDILAYLIYLQKIEEMRITIEDLEALKELNDELEENHIETEKALQEDLGMPGFKWILKCDCKSYHRCEGVSPTRARQEDFRAGRRMSRL